MAEFRCEGCKKEFKSEEALMQHNNAKHRKEIKEPLFTYKRKRKIRNWSIFIIIVVLIFWGVYSLVSNAKNLPPTGMQGHVEANPSSHITKEPMPIPIQKHMLEHADGSGPPGVVINYNCIDFECEEDLIEKLEGFADKYPTFVYVAPFRNMDVKIALTRLGQIKTLEFFDEQEIDNFINRR